MLGLATKGMLAQTGVGGVSKPSAPLASEIVVVMDLLASMVEVDAPDVQGVVLTQIETGVAVSAEDIQVQIDKAEVQVLDVALSASVVFDQVEEVVSELEPELQVTHEWE